MCRTATRLGLIFSLALALRWAYAARFPAAALLADIDAQGYHQLAVNLLAGHGFSLNTAPPYIPDTIRTPLYPLFVASVYALWGPNPVAVALAQGVVDAITSVVLVLLVHRLSQSERAALLAGLLYALHPTAWRFSDAVLTETLLALVVTALSLLMSRIIDLPKDPGTPPHTMLWLGLLGGSAALIKPNAVFWPLIMAAGLMMGRKNTWGQARGGLMIAALVMSPWVARNWVVAGRPMLSAAFEDNLSHVSAVATLFEARGETVAPWTPRWEAVYGELIAETAHRYNWLASPPRTARAVDERQQQLATVAREVIQQSPTAFARSHMSGFVRSWVPQEHRFWYAFFTGEPWEALNTTEGALGQTWQIFRTAGLGAALQFLWQARFAQLPPLAMGLWFGGNLAALVSAIGWLRGSWHLRQRPADLWFIWASVVYFTLLPGPIAYVRFRVPVEPLLVALLVVGLTAGRPKIKPP